jgi:type III restriction enzyme
MDEGAHFHRCDFQVHTPRDRQWTGPDVVSDQERRLYAATLVAACRKKNIDAVAITDHHDLVFVPYIRAAAAQEQDPSGKIFPKYAQLAVFPGMELTLAVPCQAILIFDAEFPDDLFSLVLNALAITPSPANEAKTAPTERLSHLLNIRQVCEELDKHQYLRGRYILLPNVSEGGGATILRHGFAPHYAGMPCVGGTWTAG